jgi:hypothetical protein
MAKAKKSAQPKKAVKPKKSTPTRKAFVSKKLALTKKSTSPKNLLEDCWILELPGGGSTRYPSKEACEEAAKAQNGTCKNCLK